MILFLLKINVKCKFALKIYIKNNKLKAEREGGIAIIRVDLNKCYNDVMRFYKDTSMKEDEAVFTYNNIPPKCLTKLNKINFLH